MKGRPPGSKNKQHKLDAWSLLEGHMAGDFTKKMVTIMNKYYREERYSEFAKLYSDLTKYFKPTLKATDLKVKGKVEIEIKGMDKLIDKI